MKSGISNGTVLIVDDNEDNRIVLARRLERQGLRVATAENGLVALKILNDQNFDLVLLDIMMPEMNGYQVLEYMKQHPELRHIPVIVISAVDEFDSVVRCVELGAEDYLMKPFNKVMLKARIGASLEKKQLRDQEKAFTRLLELEKAKSERLLLNILPAPIAERLKQDQATIADSYPDVTVLFADIVEFTRQSASLTPTEIVDLLSDIFSQFDNLTEKHKLEKIKTIGDAYMVVGGLPTPMDNHTAAIAELALEMMGEISKFGPGKGKQFTMRIGIHCGPVVAGVIGTNKFIYDLWGDTVNVANRMESHGIPGRIQVTSDVYARIKEHFRFDERGLIPIKGKGKMKTHFLLGKIGD